MTSASSSSLTAGLARSPLFRCDPKLSNKETTERSYERARAVARVYALTAHDVSSLSDKFCAMHMDNIIAVDAAVITLLTIQYNLAAGTIIPHAAQRPELLPLLKKVLDFEVSAQFLLTERAHGLDAPNIETTATLLPSGEFDLHTPHEGAAKFMPPTGPFGHLPRVAIVFARLIVEREDRGIRPFIVALGNGIEMCKGVSARLMPKRSGPKPVDHALTFFSHVRLPMSALLGSLSKPVDDRANFFSCIRRVGVGSLILSLITIPMLTVSAYIAARYSLRRTVTSPSGTAIPIWRFRTQQLPILRALAQVAIMRPFAKEAIALYKNVNGQSADIRIRSAIAAIVKAVLMQHTQGSLFALSERCGALGLYEENQIIASQLELRGASIAEGDTLVLSIRLATELLLGRYSIPAARHPDCLLARHEASIFSETREKISLVTDHRGDEFNRLVLPMCQSLVEAIGHRMMYEAAKDSGLASPLLELYEAEAVRLDAAWYAKHAGIGRWENFEMEERAASRAAPFLGEYLTMLEAEPYAVAPIASDDNWAVFLAQLERFEGDAALNFIPQGPTAFETKKSGLLARL